MEKRVITRELLGQYRDYLISDEKSKATVSKYMHDAGQFADYTKQRNIDKSVVISYKEQLVDGYADTSVNSMLAAVNSFLKFAGWHDCCVKPLKLQKQIYCHEDKELTYKEYLRLVKTAVNSKDECLALIIETLCATGIRVSELQYLTVESLKKGEMTVNCKGKRRVVFLVKKLCRKLLRFCRTNNIKTGSIFTTKTGRAIDRHMIWRKMKKLCYAADVDAEKVFPHNLRHLFARTFYNMEQDIVKLADILGHSSINTTRIYMITCGTEHRRKMERMRLVL